MFFEIKDVPLTFTAQLRDEDEQEKVNPAE